MFIVEYDVLSNAQKARFLFNFSGAEEMWLKIQGRGRIQVAMNAIEVIAETPNESYSFSGIAYHACEGPNFK